MMETLEERLNRIEYYQSLLLEFLPEERSQLCKLIIEAKLTEQDVAELERLCEYLSIELKTQKAEGFVSFTPLLTEFLHFLHPNLDPKRVIKAFLVQGKYISLMKEFEKMIAHFQ